MLNALNLSSILVCIRANHKARMIAHGVHDTRLPIFSHLIFLCALFERRWARGTVRLRP
jgi:hypothetical protein